jgi:hypothetical protein
MTKAHLLYLLDSWQRRLPRRLFRQLTVGAKDSVGGDPVARCRRAGGAGQLTVVAPQPPALSWRLAVLVVR